MKRFQTKLIKPFDNIYMEINLFDIVKFIFVLGRINGKQSMGIFFK